jgi:beta-glucanase (GH16 family)
MLPAAAVILATLTACSFPPEEKAVTSPTGPYAWSDEFDAPAGTPVDPAKWKFDIGNRWGDNELEYYTDSTENVAHDGNGNLAITARAGNPANHQCQYGACRYTSGRVLTAGTFEQKYGHFEARIKIPRGQGIWPAFWLLGGNNWPAEGEIDVMEVLGHAPDTLYGTAHGPGYSGADAPTRKKVLPAPLSDGFHTYAVNWTPKLIVWYLDGTEYFRLTPADLDGRSWVYDHPFHLILNVAVGGRWPGAPDASTVFPQTMLVDYVRVKAWDPAGS